MPKRTDIQSVLIIGDGPIIIGQACEFDYSGAQACKALREEGYKVILVNSNPATIMTDPEMADVTYIEPITWKVVEKIRGGVCRIHGRKGRRGKREEIASPRRTGTHICPSFFRGEAVFSMDDSILRRSRRDGTLGQGNRMKRLREG